MLVLTSQQLIIFSTFIPFQMEAANCPEAEVSTSSGKPNNETKVSTAAKTNIQDIVATYKELDTLSLARKVKDVLVANNIGEFLNGIR